MRYYLAFISISTTSFITSDISANYASTSRPRNPDFPVLSTLEPQAGPSSVLHAAGCPRPSLATQGGVQTLLMLVATYPGRGRTPVLSGVSRDGCMFRASVAELRRSDRALQGSKIRGRGLSQRLTCTLVALSEADMRCEGRGSKLCIDWLS